MLLASIGKTASSAILFVLGFAAVFTSYGTLFGAFGALLMTHQDTLVRVLGVLTILLGIVFVRPALARPRARPHVRA